jgi:hypothetical protein
LFCGVDSSAAGLAVGFSFTKHSYCKSLLILSY